MRIFLIGFMGAGKTQVGKNLAKRLKMKFIDIDREIEDNTGRTITEIFKEDKEKKFREYERKALKKIVNQNNIVVATGGGIVLSLHNRRLMKKEGVVIWLFASIDKILERTKSETHRPLLEGFNKFDRIRELLNKRKKYYKEVADYIVNTDNKKVIEIASRIINFQLFSRRCRRF